jgi:hypothetical protein
MLLVDDQVMVLQEEGLVEAEGDIAEEEAVHRALESISLSSYERLKSQKWYSSLFLNTLS